MSKNDLHRKVGEFISPVRTIVRIDQTVDQALTNIRAHHTDDKIFYVYVVDDEGLLKGVVSTRNLLLSSSDRKIQDIFEEQVISISSEHTLRAAMEILAAHRLLALPVVDLQKRLLGIIDIQLCMDDVVDVAKAKRSSTDLFQVLGLNLEEDHHPSAWKMYKARMPWIFCNMVGGISCAIISNVFELVLLEVILLAMFIPLVLTLSESISMQSMTYSLQILQRGKISWRRTLLHLMTEWKMLILLAITCGLVVGGLSLFWGEGVRPGLAIGAGIFISVTISGLVGAAIPLVLHANKLDPKVAAGPVVLMLADVITTAIYLGLSTWWLL